MNQKIWNLYKQTDEYHRLIGIFNPETKDVDATIEAIMSLSKELGDDKKTNDMLDVY